jgi:hypothetical protein
VDAGAAHSSHFVWTLAIEFLSRANSRGESERWRQRVQMLGGDLAQRDQRATRR